MAPARDRVGEEQGKRYPRVKPTFLKKSKYRYLLTDPQVNRWFRNLLRGSAVTAAERLRRLGSLCEHFDTSPGKWLSYADVKRRTSYTTSSAYSKTKANAAATSRTF